LLKQAAARRTQSAAVRMSVETLAMQIIGGTVTRGSVDRTLAAYGEYRATIRSIDGTSERRPKSAGNVRF